MKSNTKAFGSSRKVSMEKLIQYEVQTSASLQSTLFLHFIHNSQPRSNARAILLVEIKGEEEVKDFSTCVEAIPVEFLLKPLSSLSLADKPEASTSTDMETAKAVKPIIALKSNVNQKEKLLWKIKGEEEVKDFSTCVEAIPVEFLLKPLSSLSLADKPEASTSTDMESAKRSATKSVSKSTASRRRRSSSKLKVEDHVFVKIRPCCGIKWYSQGAKLTPQFTCPSEVSE